MRLSRKPLYWGCFEVPKTRAQLDVWLKYGALKKNFEVE